MTSFQGKYVEIQFTRGGEPRGGIINQFLLEKVSFSLTSFTCICGSLSSSSILNSFPHYFSLVLLVRMKEREAFTFSINSLLELMMK